MGVRASQFKRLGVLSTMALYDELPYPTCWLGGGGSHEKVQVFLGCALMIFWLMVMHHNQ